MKMKLSLFFLLFSLFNVYAQNKSPFTEETKPYWWTLEQGKKFFRDGYYGRALLKFEDARNDRREMYTRMEQDWIALLSIGEVRRMRGALDRIETYIYERGQFDAAKAIEELYYRVKKDSLNNSADKVLNIFGNLKNYPEADYWIGKTYRLEGEIGIALKQFKSAIEHSANLENPEFVTEIKYEIADIERENQIYNEMERTLHDILLADNLWREDNSSFVKTAMSRTLGNDGIDLFLTMYRYRNAYSEKAHRLLGYYYYESGRHNRAIEHLMFATLITNSTLIDEAIQKRFDYRFLSLDNLMAEISRRKDLNQFIEQSNYYKTLYYLAASLYATGKSRPARGIWVFISKQTSAGEWKGRSERQLINPFVEKSIEMP